MENKNENKMDNYFENILKINNIGSKILSRRILREYEQILAICVSIDIHINDNVETILTIKKQDKEVMNTYRFVLYPNYPFVPPKLFINDTPYISYLNLHTERFNRIYRYINGSKCMCCSAFCSRQNWSPSYTITKIFNEIENTRRIKYNIILKILADKIKAQYLIADIELDPWLFTISEPNLSLPEHELSQYHC